MRLIGLLFVSLFIASPAMAQQREGVEAPVAKKLVISEAAVSAAFSAVRPALPMQERRDSLKNGTIAGAVVGAVALGGFAGYLCHALHEEGNPPCWRGVLMISALGAGIGAAAGAGIDALIDRRSPVSLPALKPLLRIRF